MRVLDADKFSHYEKKKARRNAIFFADIAFIVIFLLMGFGGQWGPGIGIGLGVGLLLFLFVYGIASMQINGATRRYRKNEYTEFHFPVRYENELGVLILGPQQITYEALILGATNKRFSINVDENTFMAIGPLEYSKIQRMRTGNVQEAIMNFKEMPHGQFHQFTFLNVEGVLDIVGQRLDEICLFEAEKYQ